jgi:4-carboxymuconolactone decarboxylase
LLEIRSYATSDAFDARERVVLTYAEAMTETPVNVRDELFMSVQDLFSAKQIVELTSVIAWENYRARFNHALHIEAQDFAEGAWCALPDR